MDPANMDRTRKRFCSPWQRINLLRNPFGQCTREERAQLAILPEIDCVEWLRQSEEPFSAIEFIGRCGRGKTTRLLKLHWMAHRSHYVYLGQDGSIPALPQAYPLIIDEAQRLRRELRKPLFASGVPLVFGTHRSLARPLRAAGYRVITYQIGNQNDASLIFQLANRRIEAARYRTGILPKLSHKGAASLQRKFGSNLRSTESFLYDHMQALLSTPMESWRNG